MPTKTNKSPLTVPAGVIVPLAKAGFGGLTSQISNVGTEFKQIKDQFKEEGFKEKKFGEKLKMLGGAYGRLLGTSIQSGLAGASQGLLGTDFGLSEKGFLADNQTGVEEEQPKYTTNIDPMTGQEIPLTMKTPLKMLTQTGSDSPVPYNMSAAQYKSGVLMKNISGAATLMTADEKKAKIDAIPGMPEEVKDNMKAAVKKKGELKTYEVVAKDNPKGTGTKTDYTVYGGLEGEEKKKLYRKTKTQSF